MVAVKVVSKSVDLPEYQGTPEEVCRYLIIYV